MFGPQSAWPWARGGIAYEGNSMYLSTHFTLEELTASQEAIRKGIDNAPTPDVVTNLKRTALGLEQVRTRLGAPIIISSGYRSPALNAAVGGAKDSQHMIGEAADFICPGFGSPATVVSALMDSGIKFDQLIQEGKWVHISFSAKPRHQVLTAHFLNGVASYTPGIA